MSPVSVQSARVSNFLKWHSRLDCLLMSIHCLHLCRVKVFLFSALDVLLSTIPAVHVNSIIQCCPFSSMVACMLTTSSQIHVTKLAQLSCGQVRKKFVNRARGDEKKWFYLTQGHYSMLQLLCMLLLRKLTGRRKVQGTIGRVK